jgi:hypothetical protein
MTSPSGLKEFIEAAPLINKAAESEVNCAFSHFHDPDAKPVSTINLTFLNFCRSLRSVDVPDSLHLTQRTINLTYISCAKNEKTQPLCDRQINLRKI